MPKFQFVALPAELFAGLFEQTDEDLSILGAMRKVVDEKPGYPCRVSLVDAEVGEEVILVPFVHHDVLNAYRGAGPVFVRRGAPTATPAVGEVPAMLTQRVVSVRSYDAGGMMLGSEVVKGSELEGAIDRLFADERAMNLHVHNAGPGCYSCRVDRV